MKVDGRGCIEIIEAEAESSTEAQKAENRKEAVRRKRIESGNIQLGQQKADTEEKQKIEAKIDWKKQNHLKRREVSLISKKENT